MGHQSLAYPSMSKVMARDNWQIHLSSPMLYVYSQSHSSLQTSIFNASASPRTPGAGISFSFLSNSQDLDKFAISADGNIRVIGDIDREEKAVYDLIILATDTLNSTLSGTRRLTVRVLDINDNEPSFRDCPDQTYLEVVSVNVRENQPAETYVYRVKACDLDVAPNNFITYQFTYEDSTCFPNATGAFNLNSATGVITTTQVLDREIREMYRICVIARPNTSFGRRKRDTADNIQKIDVVVLDNNDNGPVFLTRNIFKAIFDLPTEEKVAQLRAVDPDSSEFNGVRYSVTGDYLSTSDGPIVIYGGCVLNLWRKRVPFSTGHGFGNSELPNVQSFVTSGYFMSSLYRAEDNSDSTMFDTTTN
ncbi:protocadherin gamma-B7-like [Argopecten irradians]|uniref:protocadherin gamma-B7-like n=1 Tax=Argopecten irradians TaxID=31199 RepID=UPI0037104F74